MSFVSDIEFVNICISYWGGRVETAVTIRALRGKVIEKIGSRYVNDIDISRAKMYRLQ